MSKRAELEALRKQAAAQESAPSVRRFSDKRAELNAMREMVRLEEGEKPAPETRGQRVGRAIESVPGGRTGARLLRSGAVGTASVADLPNVLALLGHKMGLREKPEFYASVAQKVKSQIDAETGGVLEPRGRSEEYMDAVAEAALPLFLGAPSGAGLLARISRGAALGQKPTARALAASGAAGAAAKGYIDTRREQGKEPGLAGLLAATTLGSMAGHGAATASGKVAKLSGFKPEVYAREQALGIPSTLGSTGHKGAKRVEDILSHSTFGGDRLNALRQERERALAARMGLDTAALEPGGKPKLPTSGTEGLQGYKDRVHKAYGKRKALYADVEKKLQEGHGDVDVMNLLSEAVLRKNKLSGDELKAFGKTPYGEFSDRALASTAGRTPGKAPYGNVEQIKKDAKKRFLEATPGSEERRDLSSINDALGSALEKAIEGAAKDPRSMRALQENKRFYARYAHKEKGTKKAVEELLQKPEEDVTSALLTKPDDKAIRAYMGGIPREKRAEASQAFLTSLGMNASTGRLSLTQLGTRFNALKQKDPLAAKAMLQGFGAQQRKDFEDVMDWCQRNKNAMAEVENSSKTAYALATKGDIDKAQSAAADLGKKALGVAGIAGSAATIGIPATAASVIGGYIGQYGLGRLFASPKILHHMNKALTAHPKQRDVWLNHLIQDLKMAPKAEE